MKKVCIIGHFGFGENLLNGQTIKTKTITQELDKQLGGSCVYKIDTHGGIKTLLLLPIKIIVALVRCENVLIFPAHNGVLIIAPFLYFFNIPFHRKLHYVVIGGWLPSLIEKKRWLGNILKRFDFIHVETKTMKRLLVEQGFDNIVLVPNCKKLSILSVEELIFNKEAPFKICTFSRVMKEKGIEDVISAVKTINDDNGRIIYELDIYGPIDNEQVAWFESIRQLLPEYIKYKGTVEYDQSVEVLKKYFALVFPTRFYTEGIPGTIIDAYASGVPVICSQWENINDILDEGSTGMSYEFNSLGGLIELLKQVANKPQIILDMKNACLKKAYEFRADIVVNQLIKNCL